MYFEPHGWCLFWNVPLMSVHILGDVIIALAYFMIPPMLFSMRRLFAKWQAPKNVLLLFGAFIISCGLTHVMDIVVLNYPMYWTQGIIKIITALISMTAWVYLFNMLTGRNGIVTMIDKVIAQAQEGQAHD